MSDTFPALRAINAHMVMIGDVIYGKQGGYPGSYMLFRYSVTVTELTDTHVKGINSNGNQWSLEMVGKSDVLIERGVS